MSDRIFVATRKGLFTLVRASSGYEVQGVSFLGDCVGLIHANPLHGALYVALEHGHFGPKLHRSMDGGKTFEECAVPEYPERPADADDIDPIRQKPLKWKLVKIWALAHGHGVESNVLWTGTIPGGLFRSQDAGTSWNLVRPLWDHPSRKKWFGGGADLPGIHSICVHPENPREVTVGVSCGGVWWTSDAGETWECRATGMRAEYMPPDQAQDPEVQDPHCVVQCRATPDHLWAQHHNGIFRSTDAGQSWQEIKNVQPSTFGFPVAVHPEDGNVAWFVPAVKDEQRYPRDGEMVVTRTRDGGGSFETLRSGLPQTHAYDLVYRHALDLDTSGQCLAMGSTTGSVWVSEDQGDHWQCVSTHLPPVYAVRFARATA
jgi:hypothetical protein